MTATVLGFPQPRNHMDIADEIMAFIIQQLHIDLKQYAKEHGSLLAESEGTSGRTREAVVSITASYILQASYERTYCIAKTKEAARQVQEIAEEISKEPPPPPAA